MREVMHRSKADAMPFAAQTTLPHLYNNDREKLPEALGHNVSHESAHTPAMKPEQAITPQQPEIAPVIEHGFGMG